MKYTDEMITKVANNISNPFYGRNLQATKELMELFDYISRKALTTWKDYVKMYDDNFYTYQTWDELVKSEEEQNDGLTEIECRMEINNTIFRLPCGWYVQYV